MTQSKGTDWLVGNFERPDSADTQSLAGQKKIRASLKPLVLNLRALIFQDQHCTVTQQTFYRCPLLGAQHSLSHFISLIHSS